MMGSKGRMRDPPGILRWNASYWLESSLCEKQYKCHLLTRSHISSIFRQFPSLLVQLKARCASRGTLADLVAGWQVLAQPRNDTNSAVLSRRKTCAELASVAASLACESGQLSGAV